MRTLLLSICAACVLAAPAYPDSFSCAISTVTLTAASPTYEVCSLPPSSGYISTQWITGSGLPDLGNGMEDTQVQIFVDGEASPSITYFPYELTALPSLQAFNTSMGRVQAPWGSPLFSRNSASSFTNTIPVPFASGLRIALHYTGSRSATLYYQAHGTLMGPANPTDGSTFPFGGSRVPLTARLVIQRNALTLPRLAYLAIVNFTAGEGLIAAMAIAFKAPNLNTLEGCFNLYKTATTPFPGQLHSTGTEDEFISSYYFDQGPFQGRNAGVYYKGNGGEPVSTISMWRSYYEDPMRFKDGGALSVKPAWRPLLLPLECRCTLSSPVLSPSPPSPYPPPPCAHARV